MNRLSLPKNLTPGMRGHFTPTITKPSSSEVPKTAQLRRWQRECYFVEKLFR